MEPPKPPPLSDETKNTIGACVVTATVFGMAVIGWPVAIFGGIVVAAIASTMKKPPGNP